MFIRRLVQSILDMPGEFLSVATHDPLGAVLLAIGGLITTLSVAYFGLLTVGALADSLTPEPGGQPRRPGR